MSWSSLLTLLGRAKGSLKIFKTPFPAADGDSVVSIRIKMQVEIFRQGQSRDSWWGWEFEIKAQAIEAMSGGIIEIQRAPPKSHLLLANDVSYSLYELSH